ncbi:MAG: hypothetical protein WC455_15415 [Dehalococcoidia bacterium]|jgi:hypothetical protein
MRHKDREYLDRTLRAEADKEAKQEAKEQKLINATQKVWQDFVLDEIAKVKTELVIVKGEIAILKEKTTDLEAKVK